MFCDFLFVGCFALLRLALPCLALPCVALPAIALHHCNLANFFKRTSLHHVAYVWLLKGIAYHSLFTLHELLLKFGLQELLQVHCNMIEQGASWPSSQTHGRLAFLEKGKDDPGNLLAYRLLTLLTALEYGWLLVEEEGRG